MTENQVILHTGSNEGNRLQNLAQARRMIAQRVGPIDRQSDLYLTKAWGLQDQDDFLNQVLIIKTGLTPHVVLEEILRIESEMGRKRTKKWAPRLIDIDLLFYNEEVIETPNLIVPHPFLHQRNFVLAPLSEMVPDLIHPKLGRTVSDLYRDSKDELRAERVGFAV